ncbi:hypothetical protein AB0O07_11715 [Streptomyces sp. NPDC093085]|uniref:hypothetical protein n=1 Tax=Streptomyces sp. NPDC093085 TaxID=3155068 RepID=UPI003447B0E5
MAKNKNRDRGNKQHHPRSESERGTQDSRSSAMEDSSDRVEQRITPSDVAHKRQKRFGHN